MKIGSKIKCVRELNSLTLEHVASELNMSSSEYLRLENDENGINLEQLHQLSLVFKVSIEQLITIDESLPVNQFQLNDQVIEATRLSLEMKQLYEEKIALLEEKIKNLEKELSRG